MRRVLCLALLAAGCASVDGSPPLPTERCEAAPTPAEVDGIEILSDEPPLLALDDGATLPLLFGGQGAAMTLFRVAFSGIDLPDCVPLRVTVRDLDGRSSLELDTALRTEAIGPLGATAPLVALQPGEVIEVEVEASGAELRRSFVVGGLRVGLDLIGPEHLGVGETTSLTVTLSGRAIEPVEIELEAWPPGSIELPPSVSIEPGAARASVVVRGISAGSALVRARLGEYESPAWSVTVEPLP